ncbi:MAG: hypothetical protein L0312_30530 [Acidobacteria bacterium]|nr:hypothetical protein [Acidobacteriota bacterium]
MKIKSLTSRQQQHQLTALRAAADAERYATGAGELVEVDVTTYRSYTQACAI